MRKLLTILVSSILILMCGAVVSYGANATIQITSDKKTVNSGDTFKAVFSINSTKPINGIVTKLKYSSNVTLTATKVITGEYILLPNPTVVENAKILEYLGNSSNEKVFEYEMNFTVKDGFGENSEVTIEFDDVFIDYFSETETIPVNSLILRAPSAEVPVNDDLKSITVSGKPKTEYFEGEKFDSTGITVTATYEDGTKKTITDYKITPSGALSEDDKQVTITYTEDGITKEVTVDINVTKKPEVVKKPTSVEVTKAPTKTVYKEKEKFDKTGMEITVTYDDGTKKKVTDYKITPSGQLSTNDKKVTISYTENGVTKTATVNIKVQKADTTVSPDKIVDAGKSDIVIIAIALTLLAVGTTIFIQLKKYEKI